MIKDSILTDAYLYYRAKKRDLDKKNEDNKEKGKAPVDKFSKFPSIKFETSE